MIPTMQTRTVMLIGTLSLAAGWLVGHTSASQNSQAHMSERGQVRSGPRPLGSASKEPAAPYTEQLRVRMQDVPRSPAPGRNPFSFGARHASIPSARAARSDDRPVAVAPLPAAPVFADRPRFELSGVASSERDGKAVVTAVLMDNGGLVFVAAGDKLAGGYVVVRVNDASIVIADALGTEQTVTLGQAKR